MRSAKRQQGGTERRLSNMPVGCAVLDVLRRFEIQSWP